jgi:hypothetical protein
MLLAVLIPAVAAAPAHAESCIASQYGVGDGYDGRRTASGALLDTRHALTAAHRTLPFGSRVTVRLLERLDPVEVIGQRSGVTVEDRRQVHRRLRCVGAGLELALQGCRSLLVQKSQTRL